MGCHIESSYKDRYGTNYNIRDIHYDEKKDINNNLGEYITETEYKNDFFGSISSNLSNGIYLFKSSYDESTALRIYRDFADYKYMPHDDAKLIDTLQQLQPKIKLTIFPKGVVTIENFIIGQEVAYYANAYTLSSLCSSKRTNRIRVLNYYKKILEILKELYKEGIIYSDIHARNFMIDIETDMVNLIDFESGLIYFDGKTNYTGMIFNLKAMINRINNYLDIPVDLDKAETLEDIECILNEKKLLLK